MLSTAVEKLAEALANYYAETRVQFDAAMQGFLARDSQAAVRAIDKLAGAHDNLSHFEEECTRVIALHQPVAGDLRKILTFFKAALDIDRIASLAERIARKTRKISRHTDATLPKEFAETYDLLNLMGDGCAGVIQLPNTANGTKMKAAEEEVLRLKNVLRQVIEAEILRNKEASKPYFHMLGVSRHMGRAASLLSEVYNDLSRLETPAIDD